MMTKNDDSKAIISAFKGLGEMMRNNSLCGIDLISHKIDKHIAVGNDKKVAIYLTCIFNCKIDEDGMIDEFAGNIIPIDNAIVKSNPVAMKAINYLKPKGWKFQVTEYGNLGKQFIALFPNQIECYHSTWRW